MALGDRWLSLWLRGQQSLLGSKFFLDLIQRCSSIPEFYRQICAIRSFALKCTLGENESHVVRCISLAFHVSEYRDRQFQHSLFLLDMLFV
jgi:hypothetical protein